VEGFLIAGHAQEANLCGWNQTGHAFEHAQTSTQDWHYQRGWLGDGGTDSGGNRSLHLDAFGLHLASGLIRQQRDQLISQLAENGGWGVLITKNRNLVCHQWVVDYLYAHK